MNNELTEKDFLCNLSNINFQGDFKIKFGVGYIDLRLLRTKSSKNLIITFTGAIDQKIRHSTFAACGLRDNLDVNILAIADPGLSQSNLIRSSWYMGYEEFNVQNILLKFIEKFIERFDAARIIFTGGSAGGFAALYFSYYIQGSIAIAYNPQTDLTKHVKSDKNAYNSFKLLYKKFCNMGQLKKDYALCVNLNDLYSKKCKNSIIYIQNNMSAKDLVYHSIPFFSTLAKTLSKEEFIEKVITKLDFWGVYGHSGGAVPVSEFILWTKAAINTESINAYDISKTYWELKNSISNKYEKAILEKENNKLIITSKLKQYMQLELSKEV